MTVYSRQNPFYTSIKERYCLNRPGSTKETWHIVFDLKDSGIMYRPGDAIAVLPKNHFEDVHSIIESLQFSENMPLYDPKSQEHVRCIDWLFFRVNLSTISKKCIQGLLPYIQDASCKKELEGIAALNLHDFRLYSEQYTLCSFLELYKNFITIDLQDFVPLMAPLMPRLYSIASSQKVANDEVHLTIALVQYVIHGKEHRGVCSHFLCNAEDKIGIYLQPTEHFLIPDREDTPIIMIGPGTGIAPFRGFLQERVLFGSKHNWLFFGDRNRNSDFLYQEYLEDLVSSEFLRLDCAFSRDTDEKVYVQDRMWERRDEFWEWLENGAFVYVCGDATRMAKDVEKTLLNIIAERVKGESPQEYLQDLRKKKRYLRDIY